MAKKKVMKKTDKAPKQKALPRTHRMFIPLNDAEMRMFDRYVRENKITNKSKFVRETLMLVVLKRLEADSPTLFDNMED